MLCSDGLTEMVEDKKIEEILSLAPISQAAEMLVSKALSRGGNDNITCVVVECTSMMYKGKFFRACARLNKLLSIFCRCTKKE